MCKFKVYLSFLLIVILSNNTAISQNKIVDSLITELSKAKHDTSKVNILNQLSLKIVGTDVEKAAEYSNQAIELSKKNTFNQGLALAYKNSGIISYYGGDLKKAIEYSNLSAENYKLIEDFSGEARAYNNIGIFYKNKGIYDSALIYYELSTNTFKKSEDKSGLAISYLNVAAVYQLQSDYQRALNQYFEALKIQEELKDNEQIAVLYNNIALIYQIQKNYVNAKSNFEKALKIFIEKEDKKGVADIYNNIGTIFYDQADDNQINYDSAIFYYNKSLEIFTQLALNPKIALLNYNLGNANNKLGNLSEAKQYLEISLKLYTELEDKSGIALNHNGLGEYFYLNNDFQNAVIELEKALVIAIEIGAPKIIKDVTEYLSKSYSKLGKYKEAYETHVLYKQMYDSIFNDENERELTQLSMQYEFDKKEKEQQLIHDAEIKQQKIVNIFTLIGLLLVIALAFFVYRSYRIKSKANIQLQLKNSEITQQKEEIQAQRDEIEEQRDEIEKQRDIALRQKDEIQIQKKEIEDSIHYAKRIQNAVLPARDILTKTFIEAHFIVFKPRDIVSGDFYWATQKGEELVVVAADCTGHGVPGAFMSMLGVAFLNEIVTRDEKIAANEILNLLRMHVISSLRQTGKEMESKDGMDIALCIFNKSKQTMQYSGANNPMYLVRNKQFNLPELNSDNWVIFDNNESEYHIFEIKSDRMPIGIHVKTENSFTNNEFTFMKDDIIYIFSDGYADQFGGKDDRKYTYKQFKNLFLRIQNLTMPQQQEKLFEELDRWQGKRKQLDDILILGIKL